MAKTEEKQICCSFCGKGEGRAQLIAGPNVYICSDCVQVWSQLRKEEIEIPDAPEVLPTPAEMKA